MKEGWEIKKLGDVLKIQNGYAFNSKLFSVEKGMPLIRIRDIKIGIGTETKFSGPFDKKYEVHAGDLLIGMDGEFGCYEWKGERALLNQRVCRLQEFGPELHSRFLFYGINKYLKAIEDVTAFATVKHISSKQIENIQIPLPPLPEQLRIVAILDEAFAAISQAKANAEKNLQNAKELFESYLNGVFERKGEGWEEKRLCEVCEKITDGTHQTPTYFKDGFVFLSSKNVTSGRINWTDVKYIDEKQHLEMHRRLAPRVNDILLAKNGTTGVAAIVDKDITFDIYVSLALIRVLDKVLPQFMLYFINSPQAKKQFNKRLKGIGVPNLHLEEIREVSISFPKSIASQKSIIDKLDVLSAETKKLESIYQQKIDNLEHLKKSILQKAFSGELKTEKAIVI